MKFGRNFTMLRKKMGITQEKMAEMCGVSRTALAKWERGITIPDVFMIDEIAKMFNVTIDELIHDSMDNVLDENNEMFIEKIEQVKEEIISEIRKKSTSVDLYKEYCTNQKEQEIIDDGIPVEAYSYWGMEEADKGNYDEAIKLFEEALARGNISTIDCIMAIYEDILNLYINDNDESKYWECRLEQAKKMQLYGKIMEMEIIKENVF